MRFIALLIVFSLSINDVWAESSRLSSAAASSSSAAQKNNCCFCVHPNPGERDDHAFKALCERCLPQKFENCGVSRVVPASAFTSDFVNQFNCSSHNVLNWQHGPNTEHVISQVQVCRSASPSCSINVYDMSCSTYGDDSKAQQAIKSIQDSLGGKGQVTICGSASDAVFLGCDIFRASRRYVISSADIRQDVGSCPGAGMFCSPPGSEFSCKDTLGRQWRQKCCAIKQIDSTGIWGTPGRGCIGRNSCSASNCPHLMKCRGNAVSIQSCLTLADSDSTMCVKMLIDCGARHEVCVQKTPNSAICAAPGSSSSASSIPPQ